MRIFTNGCTWTRSQIHLHTVSKIHEHTLLGAATIAIQLQDKIYFHDDRDCDVIGQVFRANTSSHLSISV